MCEQDDAYPANTPERVLRGVPYLIDMLRNFWLRGQDLNL